MQAALIASIAMIGFGLWWILTVLKERRAGESPEHWPTVQAKVIGHQAHLAEERDENEVQYRPAVSTHLAWEWAANKYQQRVPFGDLSRALNEKTFAHRTHPDLPAALLRAQAEAEAALPPGSSVGVRLQPRSPQRVFGAYAGLVGSTGQLGCGWVILLLGLGVGVFAFLSAQGSR